MASILSYMTDDEKGLIENVCEFLFNESSSSFLKVSALEKCERIIKTDEYKEFINKKQKELLREGELND